MIERNGAGAPRLRIGSRLLVGLIACAAWFSPGTSWAEFMMRTNVAGQTIEGEPLAWNDVQVLLMGRDGQLYDFDPTVATGSYKTAPRFYGYSSSEMKSLLRSEFDKRFDISTTQHYLIVHPAGERDQWAGRFEELYKRFTHYFRIRGFQTQEPPYPLVAIVFREKDEYYRHAAAGGTALQPNTLGHYEPRSNRVFLYDVTTDAPHVDWSTNASTIIHEATHQTAYNVGIHRRFTGAPRWLVEGLATMFEARGMWNSQYDRTQADRINVERLSEFRTYVATRRQAGALVQLLSSDRAFKSDPMGAYAEAWALSFYLSETRPRLYAKYLQKVADRPMFSDYSDAERMADFQDVFGNEMRMFEAKFLQFFDEEVK